MNKYIKDKKKLYREITKWIPKETLLLYKKYSYLSPTCYIYNIPRLKIHRAFEKIRNSKDRNFYGKDNILYAIDVGIRMQKINGVPKEGGKSEYILKLLKKLNISFV